LKQISEEKEVEEEMAIGYVNRILAFERGKT